MRLISILAVLSVSILSTPIFAQVDCCQCGPSACGPAEAGNCGDCERIINSVCNGDTGQCSGALEGSLPQAATPAPVLGGSPVVLLTAALTALAVSLLGRRRHRA